MRARLFSIFYLLLFSFFLGSSLTPSATLASSAISHKIPVIVSATIGEPKLTLFGLTSPFANVEVSGLGIFEQTRANSKGYFVFDRIFLPLSRQSDFCVLAHDRLARTTAPVCLPPPPQGPYLTIIGPVILPPTLSLEKGEFLPLTQIGAFGETIPNTKVVIPFYQGKFYPLKYPIKSNKEGYFSFNLPSLHPASFRTFARAFYLGNPSPKSNTLYFKVLSFWEYWLSFLKFLLQFIPRLPILELLILAELFILFLLIFKKRKPKSKSLIVAPFKDLVKKEG